MVNLKLSELPKLWIIDLDGTIIYHNSHKKLPQRLTKDAKNFLDRIPIQDQIIFITAREKIYADITENFLKANQIRFNIIIYDIPHGERILINDSKPSGLKTAYAINVIRDIGLSQYLDLF